MTGKHPTPAATDNAPTGAAPPACRIARFGRVVTDIERAERFLTAGFGFTTISRTVEDNRFAELVGVLLLLIPAPCGKPGTAVKVWIAAESGSAGAAAGAWHGVGTGGGKRHVSGRRAGALRRCPARNGGQE